MDTVYFLFGTDTVRIYNEQGFDALKKAIADGCAWGSFAFDHDSTPTDLLNAFSEFGEFTEIERDEFDELVGN